MKRALLLLAGAVFLAGPAAAQETAGATAVEPSSGVSFPLEITVPGTENTERLMGMGIRTKTFLKVKVYAFGLYVDPVGAREALSEFAGKSAKELEKDPLFFGALLQRQFSMSLRLVMTRDVGGEDMGEAFDGALRPRVQEAALSMDMPGGEDALDQFRGFFNVDQMTKESEIVFSCDANGALRTSVKGIVQPDIDSPALCWALFDVYLGEKPISGDGKKKIIQGFPDLLGGN